MSRRPFKQVDVFTDLPYHGNPVAVVLDGAGLSTEAMQRFTDWTHLSEATFILPATHPEADYRLRIFCPGRELPFAGHPTLGSAHAWLESGGQPKGPELVQECGAGLVRLRREDARLAFAAPPRVRSGPLPEAEVQALARGLHLAREDIVDHAWCDNGPGWRGILLRSREAVLALQPDALALAGLFVGVAGACVPPERMSTLPPGDCAFEVRAFFPGPGGFSEDPVTGSLNAALGQWLIAAGRAPQHYIASQGTALGRSGRVHVLREDGESGTVWVGGDCVTCVDGFVLL
jgi:PhzF family phenazine biosynthesis protein